MQGALDGYRIVYKPAIDRYAMYYFKAHPNGTIEVSGPYTPLVKSPKEIFDTYQLILLDLSNHPDPIIMKEDNI